jgi:AAA domain
MAAAHAQPHVRQDVKAIPSARKAEKRQVKLKLGIQGPSGSGKTEGALALATNLWPDAKILVVDTENESASLYADRYDFDTIPLDPPFESQRYEACIDYAVENKYDVLILDSVTHQWDGEGGILRRKEELDRRPNSNSFTNWATFTPEHTHFIESIKQAPIHIIATMRSKQEYALQQNDKGKSKPVKLGLSPIQRDGFDYEFTVVFDVQMDHRAIAIKNRTGLFGDKTIDLADPKTAEKMRLWLESGKPVDAPAAPANVTPAPPKPQPVPVPRNGNGAPAVQKVDGFSLDGDILSCYVYEAVKRKAKNGNDFIAVKHNGQVNGKDIAFCFNDRLFDAALLAKGQHCKFFLSLGSFITVEDVIQIGEQEFRDGQPYTKPAEPPTDNIHGVDVTDDDIPF